MTGLSRTLPSNRRLRIAALTLLQKWVGNRIVVSTARDGLPSALRKKVQGWAAPVRVSPASSGASLPIECEPLSLKAEIAPPVSASLRSASIVIPVRNEAAHTRLCLDSIRAFTPVGFEVIVVDNASTDATPRLLETYAGEWPALRIVRNDTNTGFPRAVNAGVRAAHMERIVVLNNDTVVTPHWLERLLAPLHRAEVGLTGPCTNDSGDIATVAARYRSLPELLEHANTRTSLPTLDVAKLSLFCAAFRRADFDAVGGLDEAYGLGMFEDDDLCMSLKKLGLRIVLVESAYVHHFAGASFRRLPARAYIERFETNRYRFEQKWRTRWTPQL